MKKTAFLLCYLFLFSFLIVPFASHSQGIYVPNGKGAWGNMIYGGFALSTPQPYSGSTFQYTDENGNGAIGEHDANKTVGGFGIGFGNPVNGLGVQLGSAMLDVSNQNRYNFGIKIHRYLGQGTSVAVGLENIFNFGSSDADSDIGSSEYISLSRDLKYTQEPGTFLSKMSYTMGVGFGRFSKLSEMDKEFSDHKNGTYVFGAMDYRINKYMTYQLEWSGINLNTGVTLTGKIQEIPFSVVLCAADLTPYSGGRMENGVRKDGFFAGTRFVGAVGLAYQFKSKSGISGGDSEIYQQNQEDMLYRVDSLEQEIQNLEKEINTLKGESGTTVIEGYDEDYLKDKVKNFKGDDIVRVLPGSNDEEQMEGGYYVIVYSYKKKELAEEKIKKEKAKGVNAGLIYNKNRSWYYVYTHQYNNLKDALQKSTEQRENGYVGAWVHIY